VVVAAQVLKVLMPLQLAAQQQVVMAQFPL
jgi:hypothetical protein